MNLARDLAARAFGSEPVGCTPPKGPARYETLAEPCGGYAVFDICRGHPADIGGQVLIGLERRDAVLVTYLLNEGRLPGAKYLTAALIDAESIGAR
jgi:hypothetical protein